MKYSKIIISLGVLLVIAAGVVLFSKNQSILENNTLDSDQIFTHEYSGLQFDNSGGEFREADFKKEWLERDSSFRYCEDNECIDVIVQQVDKNIIEYSYGVFADQEEFESSFYRYITETDSLEWEFGQNKGHKKYKMDTAIGSLHLVVPVSFVINVRGMIVDPDDLSKNFYTTASFESGDGLEDKLSAIRVADLTMQAFSKLIEISPTSV